MLIVWGRKIVYRRKGYVADFCPICRAKRAFELRRVGSAGHVYYISVGEGTLVGFQIKCRECGTVYDANPDNYAAISRKLVPLDELTFTTFPNFNQVYRERLELEARIAREASFLSAGERKTLIREPFLLLSPDVEQRLESFRIDLAGIFIMLVVVLLLAAAIERFLPDFSGLSFLILLGVGFVVVVWRMLGYGRRFMRRQIIPRLVRALEPLHPHENEIKAILADLKQLGHKIGRKLRVDDLMRELSRVSQDHAARHPRS